jgi:hypothetical protein
MTKEHEIQTMNTPQTRALPGTHPNTHPLYTHSGDWIARGIGLLVNAFFLLIVFLTVTGHDSLTPQGWPVVASLLVCILGVFTALRWERLGGRMVLGGVLALIPAVLYSAYSTGFGVQGLIVGLVVYPVPFLIVASLFLADNKTN